MMRLNITRFWLVSLFVAGLGLTAVACGDPDEGTSEETLNNDSDPGNNDTDNPDNNDTPDNNDAEDPVADCSQPEPLSGTISDDLTLTEDTCYRVDGGLKVSSGALLTIEPGVVVEFPPDTGLSIGGGKINAEGTETQPIYLTGVDKTPGSWKGVLVDNSNSSQNVLRYVVLEYGGSGDNEALLYIDDEPNPSRIKIEHSTFRKSLHWAIVAERNDGPQLLDAFNNNTLTANENAMWIHADDVGEIGADNSFSGNDQDYIDIEGTVSEDQTWGAQDVPYYSGGIDIRAKLTVEAGATVKSKQDAGIRLSPDASLSAVGTDEAPITFEGVEDVAGAWTGIFVKWSNSTANRFDHVVVKNGGAGDNGESNLFFDDDDGAVRFEITNSEFSNSLNRGVWMETDDNTHNLTEFSGNTITGNKIGLRVNANDLGEIAASNQLTGNDDDVQVSGVVADDQTWEATDAVYSVLGDIRVEDAHLTIAEGVELSFAQGTQFEVKSTGALTASGTSDKPILMTAASQTNGSWEGVFFRSSTSPENALNYVTVEYGGDGDAGNLFLDDDGAGTRLSIENSTFRHSGGYGIYIEHNDNDPQLEGCTGNTYDDNDEGQTNWTDQEC